MRQVLERVHPQFDGVNIVEWWDTLPFKQFLGSGQTSFAYSVQDTNSAKYIVRITPIAANLMVRKAIQHELAIYNRILQHPAYTLYVSELLYADCPTHYTPGNETQNTAFFIFRYSQGLPLNTLLAAFQKGHMKITERTVRMWRSHLAEALDFLHSLHIIHRDIKPANMYVDTDTNRLLLFDFETACIAGEDCKSYEIRGTRAYAHPESLQRQPFVPYQYSERDDEYAVAQLFQEIQVIQAGSSNIDSS